MPFPSWALFSVLSVALCPGLSLVLSIALELCFLFHLPSSCHVLSCRFLVCCGGWLSAALPSLPRRAALVGQVQLLKDAVVRAASACEPAAAACDARKMQLHAEKVMMRQADDVLAGMWK